jgi:hypothetical protein
MAAFAPQPEADPSQPNNLGLIRPSADSGGFARAIFFPIPYTKIQEKISIIFG